MKNDMKQMLFRSRGTRLLSWLLALTLALCPLALTACDYEPLLDAVADYVGDALDAMTETSGEWESNEGFIIVPKTEQVTEPVKPAEKQTEKVTEKQTEKVTEKATEKVTEKITEKVTEAPEPAVVRGEYYYEVDDVALYLHTFGVLPDNYITKNEATKRGWDSSKGNLWDVLDGFCIGGDYFGNYEGILPKKGNYKEADVNYHGGYRGADRLIFDTKGNIWYTVDHYKTFEKLY